MGQDYVSPLTAKRKLLYHNKYTYNFSRSHCIKK